MRDIAFGSNFSNPVDEFRRLKARPMAENITLEQVFKVSGVPTYTFVQPQRYQQLKVAIRTPGRCVVVEGPSGIGKTSSVTRILEELDMKAVTFLSARRPADIEYIAALPDMDKFGVVIVDDFHRLGDDIKARISDFMKLLADEGQEHSKIILIGINKAGDRLVQHGADVGLRLDVFKLEQNPADLVDQLISLGENALNITVEDRDSVVKASQGSFQITQLLCHQICIEGGVTERLSDERLVATTLDDVLDEVVVSLRRIFHEPCVQFAQGSKLRREGRAPYLHILKWLTYSEDWSVDLRRAIRDNPNHRGSVGQVVSKGYLESLLRDKADILDEVFHYQPETSIFTVEDPKVIFYLRSINWRNFVKEVGFSIEEFRTSYDIALSFAGADRDVAKLLNDQLVQREVAVFYDLEEQHRILASKVEDYLAPIYASEASYVIPLLSPDYPNRIWTKFESDQFRGRFGQNAVIPIRFRTAADGYFNDAMSYGSLSFDPAKDVMPQVAAIADTICLRLQEDRMLQSETPRDNDAMLLEDSTVQSKH